MEVEVYRYYDTAEQNRHLIHHHHHSLLEDISNIHTESETEQFYLESAADYMSKTRSHHHQQQSQQSDYQYNEDEMTATTEVNKLPYSAESSPCKVGVRFLLNCSIITHVNKLLL